MMRSYLLLISTALMLACTSARAAVYSNGFEVNTDGWFDATRVASGTNGVTSASGSWHAEVLPGSIGAPSSDTYTEWGGYNFGAGYGAPTTFKEYTTSLGIYLNVGGGSANDSRFDFDSAIADATGNFQRDYIFNAGFYNASDLTGPGAGTNRFVITASNNSQRGSAFAKNPDRDSIAISTTGWYTFTHHFYDDGGLLAVDMSIYDASDSLVHTWSSLSAPFTPSAGESISSVGGNLWGWFDTNEFSTLAFDNTQLSLAAVPEASVVVFGGLVCGAVPVVHIVRKKWRRRRA